MRAFQINDRVRAILPIVSNPNIEPVVYTDYQGTVIGFNAEEDCYYVRFDKVHSLKWVVVKAVQIEKVDA